MKKLVIAMSAALIAAMFFGCAARETIAKTPEPTPETTAAVEEPTPEATPSGTKYVVQKGDTLWAISSMGKIYEDPFQWPLLFKANRDSITDPDIIEVGQQLDVRKDFGADEVSDAEQKAKDTPPYKPHTAPRKKLPLKY